MVQFNELPRTVNVALQRKEVRVQFYVYNSDTGASIQGATVKPEGLSSQTTKQDGTTTFLMQMGKTYECEVSVYDYQPATHTVTVDSESIPQQRVGISNKTYSAHITVKSRNGYNINRAYVTYGGKSGYTNYSGQLTLTGIQSGTYNAMASADNYESQTKNNVSIQGSDTYIDFILDYELTTTYIYLRKENVLQPYTFVNVRTTAPDGSNYSNATEQTNGSGRVTVSSPSGGYVYASASDSQCVSTGEEITDAGGSSIYLYLWKALIVTYSSSPQTPSVSSGVYEIVGSEVRVQGGSRNTSNPSTVYANFRNHTRATAIKQWPESFSIQGSTGTYNVNDTGGNPGAFMGCTSLSSIATNTIPSISGGVISWFRGCTSLRSIPQGLFTKMTGNSAAGAFYGSGVTSLPSGQLVPTSCIYHSSMFRECKSLTSCVGNGTFGRGGGTEDFHAVFYECTNLKNMGGMQSFDSPFSNSTNAQYMMYTFGRSGVTELPMALFKSCTNVVSFEGCFEGCNSLRAWTMVMFGFSSKLKNMNSTFENCQYIYINFENDPLPSGVTTAINMFKNCKNIYSIVDLNIKNGSLQNASGMFEGSGVQQVPANFFNGMTTLTNLRRCFANCTSLVSFGKNGDYVGMTSTTTRLINVNRGNQFENTPMDILGNTLDCTEMFANCTNLSLGAEQSYAVSYTSLFARASSPGVAKVNMDKMFYGCSKLGAVPVYELSSGTPNYRLITDSTDSSVVSHKQTFYGTNCKNVPSGWK